MVCRLCLTKGDNSILIFSEEKILKYITKFLQIEITPEDPVSKVICTICWENLVNFQKFCIQVEEAQKSLKTLEEDLVKEEVSSIFVKDLSPVKVENPAEETLDNSCFNVNISECLDESILKVEMHLGIQNNTSTLETEKESVSVRTLREKRKLNSESLSEEATSDEEYDDNEAFDDEEYDDDEDEEDEENEEEDEEYKERRKNKTSPHAKRKRRNSQKDSGNTPKSKTGRAKKLTRAMLVAREQDAIIKKYFKLTCDICSCDLADFNDLKNHFRSVHNRVGYAVCCKKKLKNRGLTVDHIKAHNDPNYFKCKECGKVMSDRFCMQRHMISFHPTEEIKKFQCSYCPEKLASQYLLDLHTIKHIPEDKCTFVCKECGSKFPTNSLLNSHIKRKHSTAYDRMCEICAKLFRHKSAFERHMEEHDGIIHPQVQCEECGSWLKDKTSLQKHINNKHDHQEHICNICGKQSTSKSALQSHIKYMHEITPDFKCTFCDKSFKKALKLKEHTATHTGELLYTCPHCPTKFNAKSNMHSHRKKMHREEWEANRRCAKKEPKLEAM